MFNLSTKPVSAGELMKREILVILAPLKTSKQIMEDINCEFGINSKANGIIIAVPTEKAYKI